MKKIIALALSVLMILTCFVGCGEDAASSELANAIAFLQNMYQKGKPGDLMDMLNSTDVVASVVVDDVTYSVEWKVEVTEGDKDSVKVIESEKENCVLIDIPVPEKDVFFTATATVKGEGDATESIKFNYKVPGTNMGGDDTSAEDILTEAYALAEGAKMEGTQTLTGKITAIDTPYSKDYKNVTVTIVVDGFEDKPIQCFRLEGDGADTLAVGDVITVSGNIVNYKGKVQFDAKCKIDEVVKAEDVTDTPDAPNTPDTPNTPNTPSTPNNPSKPGTDSSTIITDVAKIMKDAQALAHEQELSYTAVLTGEVISIDTPYNSEFKNITVKIKVSGYDDTPVQCYRLSGTGVDKIKKNDTITVSGTIKKYNKTIEFVTGCTMTKRVAGKTDEKLTDPAEIMEAAYELGNGEGLGYDVTLEGKVKSIDTFYDATYGNISVWITVAGKDLLCYRMTGTGVDKINVGDTITVTGSIINYNGKIEFAQGCTMRKRVATGTAVTAPTDPKQIVDAAFALAPNDSLPYQCTLTGKITKIDTAYDPGYKNLSVVIEVDGTSGKKEILCYRMKGEGAENLKVGDTITVSGKIKRYVDTSKDRDIVEFDTGCTFVKK